MHADWKYKVCTKDIHKARWMSPDGVTSTEIEYVLIDEAAPIELVGGQNLKESTIDFDHPS